MGTGAGGGETRRKFRVRTVFPSTVTRSPASIWRSVATVSRMRVKGRRKGTPPQVSTIVSLEMPRPRMKRPGVSCATEPAPAASTGRARV